MQCHLKGRVRGEGGASPRGVSDRRQLGELNLLLPLPSWWQMKRYFTRLGNRRSVHYKLYPDVVIVHPEPRFNTAMNAEQWREACILALLAYCNHGPCCAATTFADLKSLQALGSRCCRSDENMYNRNWSIQQIRATLQAVWDRVQQIRATLQAV